MFARAVKLDPGHALARAYLALTLYVEEFLNQAHLGPGLARALDLAEEAVELADEDSRCHRILAEIALAAQAFERADHHSRRALELNPNDPHAAAYRSYVLAFLGQHEEAIGWMRWAMRLNPFHPGWYWPALGRLLHYAGQHEEAVRAFERVAAPRFFNLAYWAASHARLGHTRDAECLLAQALAAKPDLSVGGWFMLQPFRREEDRRGLKEGLLAAGLPS
jgi:adenylate cyclase